MIYWHVDRKALCVHSQLKSCSSSEVAAMIEGLLRHQSNLEIEGNYVDTHGQSEIGFAFTELLGYKLLPRLKRIGAQRLYLPTPKTAHRWPALRPVLTRPINWKSIADQYDQLIRYATAINLGTADTADTETILRRFTRTNVSTPHVQGAPRTRQSHPHNLPLRLSHPDRTATREQRRPQRRRKLELRQRIHPLRQPR